MTDPSTYGVGSLTPADDSGDGFVPNLLNELQLDLEPLAPEFPCPKCERVFQSSNQLGGHISSAHRAEKAKVPCPECRKLYQPGVGLASHRSRAHGVAGTSKSVQARNAAKERKETERERDRLRKAQQRQVKRTLEKKTLREHPLGFKVEVDNKWDTDDIFEVVVAQMWPGGTIPLSAVMPLIRWREATREMIESLHSDTQT